MLRKCACPFLQKMGGLEDTLKLLKMLTLTHLRTRGLYKGNRESPLVPRILVYSDPFNAYAKDPYEDRETLRFLP